MPRYTLHFQASDPIWRPKPSPEPFSFESSSDEMAVDVVARQTGYNTGKPGLEALDFIPFWKDGGSHITREDGVQIYPVNEPVAND